VIRLTQAADGTTNLHLWREGEEYLHQKGDVFLEQWNNVIFATTARGALKNTIYLDLSLEPLPFASATFDAAYAYHVFEHLTLAEAQRCIRDIRRVLKPDGLVRISVPNLEDICRLYLDALQKAWDRPTWGNLVHYRWVVMAMFEQMVRQRSGGLMVAAIERGDYREDDLRQLFGDALNPIVRRTQPQHGGGPAQPLAGTPETSPVRSPAGLIRRAARVIRGALPHLVTRRVRDRLEIDPRLTKEAVRWMHDRLSLKLLLEEAGFVEISHPDYRVSRIANWATYNFDQSRHGDHPLDPSVFIEGRRPGKHDRP
jgi:predicted SAM-dependent methyltransferase